MNGKADSTNGKHRVTRPVLAGLGGVLLLAYLPYGLVPYQLLQVCIVMSYAVAILGLTLVTGHLGLLSVGQGAFFAVGAYVTAIAVKSAGLPFLVAVILAVFATFALGGVFGFSAVRLSGLYLAVVTLGLAVVLPPVIKRFDGITGGAEGIVVTAVRAPSWSGLADDQWKYMVCVFLALIGFVAGISLLRSGVGRTLRAVRDNEIAARSIGVRLSTYKTVIFALGAAFAGLGGAMYTAVVGYVSPSSFPVTLSIVLFAGLLIGGTQSVLGAVFGAALIVYVPVAVAEVDPSLTNVVFGAFMVVSLILLPGGAAGLFSGRKSKAGATPIEYANADQPPTTATELHVSESSTEKGNL